MTIAEQVQNHLDYGQISFDDSGIENSEQFSHWHYDWEDNHFAIFIDGSWLRIETK